MAEQLQLHLQLQRSDVDAMRVVGGYVDGVLMVGGEDYI